MADSRFDVVVIGSYFVDMISYVPHFPKFYETVKGTKFQLDFGGKAANQCVMAQKLGAKTAMVTKIGNDQFGKDTIQNFEKFGVNTDFISVTDKAETGITSIGKVLLDLVSSLSSIYSGNLGNTPTPTITTASIIQCTHTCISHGSTPSQSRAGGLYRG